MRRPPRQRGRAARERDRDPCGAAGEAHAAHPPALLRRANARGRVAAVRHLPHEAEPVLPPRRGRCAARRRQRGPLRATPLRVQGPDPVHRDHAQPADNAGGRRSVWGDNAGAGRLDDRRSSPRPARAGVRRERVELVTVGTGTVAPSARRIAPCHWVARGDLRILLDCGPGALHRLAEFGLPWQQITHVVLTHFHPDHFGELPMLVFALRHATEPPRKEPLVILGPVGTVRLVKALAQGFGSWLLDPGFPIGILDVRDREPFPLGADVSLETFPVPHTPESVALSLTAPEGRLVYTGDTCPSSELARWATGADLLLAECSLPKEMAIDSHLTPEQAGELARDSKARQLVLTHFYPPVETSDPARVAGTRFTGRVTAARDGDRFTIGGK